MFPPSRSLGCRFEAGAALGSEPQSLIFFLFFLVKKKKKEETKEAGSLCQGCRRLQWTPPKKSFTEMQIALQQLRERGYVPASVDIQTGRRPNTDFSNKYMTLMSFPVNSTGESRAWRWRLAPLGSWQAGRHGSVGGEIRSKQQFFFYLAWTPPRSCGKPGPAARAGEHLAWVENRLFSISGRNRDSSESCFGSQTCPLCAGSGPRGRDPHLGALGCILPVSLPCSARDRAPQMPLGPAGARAVSAQRARSSQWYWSVANNLAALQSIESQPSFEHPAKCNLARPQLGFATGLSSAI